METYYVLAKGEFTEHTEYEREFTKIRFRGEELWVGDEHHKIDELYEHRYRLFLALVKIYDNYITPMGCNVLCWKTKKHDDGTMFPDFFLLGMTVTKRSFISGIPDETYDISYHLPIRFWNMINVMETPKAPPYDGYTPEDILNRLARL
jgi:hypothetical protein